MSTLHTRISRARPRTPVRTRVSAHVCAHTHIRTHTSATACSHAQVSYTYLHAHAHVHTSAHTLPHFSWRLVAWAVFEYRCVSSRRAVRVRIATRLRTPRPTSQSCVCVRRSAPIRPTQAPPHTHTLRPLSPPYTCVHTHTHTRARCHRHRHHGRHAYRHVYRRVYGHVCRHTCVRCCDDTNIPMCVWV